MIQNNMDKYPNNDVHNSLHQISSNNSNSKENNSNYLNSDKKKVETDDKLNQIVKNLKQNITKKIETNKEQEKEEKFELNMELIDETYNDLGRQYIDTNQQNNCKNHTLILSPHSPFSYYNKNKSYNQLPSQ